MIGAAIGLTQSDVAPVLQGRDLPIREARRKMDGVAIGVPGGDASSIPDHLKKSVCPILSVRETQGG